MTMILKGKYTDATIIANTIESGVIRQTLDICNHPIFKDCPIRIMPDCHEGKGCVIGFTAPLPKNGEIIPNIIGADQSCGVVAAQLPPDVEIDFNRLDEVIRTYIPSGINGRKTIAKGIPDKLRAEIERYNKDCLKRDATDDLLKLGSLGGGNHFISVEKGQTGTYLIIHSGSRNFGNEMARYFQKIAMDTNLYSMKELSYLSGKDAEDYMNCAKTCYFYGQFSRWVMIHEICKHMNFDIHELIETVHNYIGDDNIIRKGAIACHKDANAIIPLNMRDGSLLIKGKGNQHWNFSGPHGAGRILSRSKAKEQLKLEDYQEAMKGIYSSCISNSTLDEAPMAYKNGEEIKDLIEPTAEVYDHLIPVYNFKAS